MVILFDALSYAQILILNIHKCVYAAKIYPCLDLKQTISYI